MILVWVFIYNFTTPHTSCFSFSRCSILAPGDIWAYYTVTDGGWSFGCENLYGAYVYDNLHASEHSYPA